MPYPDAGFTTPIAPATANTKVASSKADDPEAWARASNVDLADRLAGKLLLIHGEMGDQVHSDHTMRLADRLIAADKTSSC
ncbi:MAG: prolyl oligopeptidase family serine peptidase [Actinomycetota bacterium]